MFLEFLIFQLFYCILYFKLVNVNSKYTIIQTLCTLHLYVCLYFFNLSKASISRFVGWSVPLSLCLCVRVFTFELPFKCLFAPHFQKSDVKKLGFSVFLVVLETTLPDGLEISGRRAYR